MKKYLIYELIICIPFVIVLLIQSVIAKELDSVKMPDKVTVGEKELVLNGMGTRKATIFSVKVYVMGLYLERRSKDAEAIIRSGGTKMIVMKFVRDVSADKLIDGWQEGFEKNYPEVSAVQKELDLFKRSMRDIKKGESIVLSFADDSVEVKFDEIKRSSIQGEKFRQALLAVWLGPEPPNADLKKGILGE